MLVKVTKESLKVGFPFSYKTIFDEKDRIYLIEFVIETIKMIKCNEILHYIT